MGIEYRKLSENELDVFIEMRINQLREEGAKEDIDLKPALMDYYMRHMRDGTFVSWVAVDDGRIIGTSGMSFVEKPPYFGCPSGKMGLLSSMFTNPNKDNLPIVTEYRLSFVIIFLSTWVDVCSWYSNHDCYFILRMRWGIYQQNAYRRI